MNMAMTCLREERKHTNDGRDVRRVLIVADETPEALPITGEGVDRLPDDVIIDIASVLRDLQESKSYVLGSDGWHEWVGSSSGGSGGGVEVAPLDVTENGTYAAPDGSAYNPVEVDVPPYGEGEVEITENGEHDVSGKAKAIVNVPSSGGGGGSVDEDADVIFIDYDGDVLYSYSKDEFLALDALPENPEHDGLVAQGWNWQLSGAKKYVSACGKLIVGQTYTTNDGKTRFYVKNVNNTSSNVTVKFNMSGSSSGDIVIDWGDGSPTEIINHDDNIVTPLPNVSSSKVMDSPAVMDGADVMDGPEGDIELMATPGENTVTHTYETAGNYVITFEPINGATLSFGSTKVMNGRAFSGSSGCELYRVDMGSAKFGSGYSFYQQYHLEAISHNTPLSSTTGALFSANSLLKSCTLMRTSGTCRSMCSSCGSLKRVSFGELSGSIAENTFQDCYNLKTITMNSSVSSIGNDAFSGCTGMREYHINRTTPPTLGSEVFNKISPFCKIYVPYSEDHSILNAYKTATNWSDYADYIYEEPQD